MYILGSLSGTQYIGFTGYLHRRVFQHKFQPFDGFAKQHELHRLLYWESYDGVHKATGREKQLKRMAAEQEDCLHRIKEPAMAGLEGRVVPMDARAETVVGVLRLRIAVRSRIAMLRSA